MNKDLQKRIEEQIETLPEEIKSLVLGNEWKVWVGGIVKKNSLNLDQASTLESEIFVFLIGLVTIFDLRKSIQEDLHIPVSKVNDIMIDINDMIVEPLKQKLINATNGEEEEDAPLMPVMKSIRLKEKEEEILDRQKVLSEIEEAGHARGVGVFVPNEKREAVNVSEYNIQKIQPIANNAQISTPQSQPKIGTSAPSTIKPVDPVPPARPVNIFEAKTSGVVAPTPMRSNAEVITGKLPQKPISEKTIQSTPPTSGASSDPYREPIA